MGRSESILKLVMRLAGAVMLLAFVAASMPTSWMAGIHGRLGLGDFPASPLVDYLARSASLLYGVHGGLLILLASRPHRFRPVIAFLAGINLPIGVALVAIDLRAGLPWYWTAAEGPSVFAYGVLVLILLRGVPEGAPSGD